MKKIEEQKVSVKGFIYRNDCVFMVKDLSGNWELPGGKIAYGEHPESALKREFYEELGIDVEVGEVFYVWDFFVQAQDRERHYILIFFECRATCEDIVLSDEHSEFCWMELDKAESFPMKDGYRQAINKMRKKYA